jgi:hypothetical protein
VSDFLYKISEFLFQSVMYTHSPSPVLTNLGYTLLLLGLCALCVLNKCFGGPSIHPGTTIHLVTSWFMGDWVFINCPRTCQQATHTRTIAPHAHSVLRWIVLSCTVSPIPALFMPGKMTKPNVCCGRFLIYSIYTRRLPYMWKVKYLISNHASEPSSNILFTGNLKK